MEKEKSAPVGGIGLIGLTFVAFLVLKLCKVINWSWWWVFSPLWGAVLLVIIGVIAYFAILLAAHREDEKHRNG